MTRRNAAFALGLLSIVVIVSGALVEVVLRVYAGVAEGPLARALRQDPYAVLVEPHGEAGYRPRPDRTFLYGELGTAAHTNSMGFRGPTVAVPKPEGTIRVVLLGGSTTFGWGVDDDETIDAFMRDLLTERHPAKSVEVANLAFDGYDSYQLLERFRTDALPLDPDVVIVNTGVNDVRNAWYRDLVEGDRRTLLYLATMDQLRLEEARGGPTPWTRTKHWFYMARLPGWLLGRATVAAAVTSQADRAPRAYHWDAVDYFERNVRRIVDMANESGPSAVLLSTPPSALRTLYDPSHPMRTDYWLHDAETTQVYRDSLAARLRTVAAEEAARGRAVAYVQHAELAGSLFLDDAHLTPEGNLRMAEDFVAALEPWLSEETSSSRR